MSDNFVNTTSSSDFLGEREKEREVGGELFDVVSGGLVDLGDVLVSNKHEFSAVEILNKTNSTIRVDLSSTVATLGFQFSNENFGSPEVDVGTPESSDKHNFNQVFNYVNLIKSLEVRPHQQVAIWISYRPNFQPRKSQDILSSLEYREVGDIILQARSEDSKKTQKSKLKFTCKCCLPLLEVSATELDFGLLTSVPNEANTQIQEFTISNNSVIPLDIVLRLARGGGALCCMVKDYDQNEDLIDKDITLGAHEFKRVQVTVWARPDTTGDHDMQLRVENRSDQTTRSILVCGTIAHSTSAAKPLTELTLPKGANFIDFGSCYAGEGTTQMMSITNQSINPVYVQFDHDSTDIRDRVKGKLAVRVHDEQLKEQRDELCEVFLKPGVTEKLDVCYTPDLTFDKKKVHSHSKRIAGDKLQQVRFRLFVRTAVLKDGEQVPSEGDKKHSKGISCRAMVCTSRVEVKEREIDFGDSLLGKTASCHVTIENPTALPAGLRIEYDSKIMKAVSGNDVVIKENSAVSLEFQIVPHKVNPSFCKQVYLRNIHNPKDIWIINLSSNNIDSMTSTHAQYYSLNFLNKKRDKEDNSTRQAEGVAVEATPGFPSLRAFRLKNKQDTKLVLSLATSKPQYIKIYVASKGFAKSQLLRTFATEGFLKALPERDAKAERDYVNNVLRLKQELDEVLKSNQLVAVKDLTLEPESEVVCYILFEMSGKRGSRDESINISVKNMPGAGERQIPVAIQIHETALDIGLLTNLNLGHVVVGERSSCVINLSNSSHLPLFFEVVKDSQSLQSTQLRIEGTREQRFVGLVRPFARRPLEVTFHPSMRGKLHERLAFVNLLSQTQKTLTIKADVSKIATFEVKPALVDIGTVVLGDTTLSPAHFRTKDAMRTKFKFTLINIGKSKREYLISPSPETPLNLSNISMTVEFDVETVKAQASSRNLEEEIEALEQKIKGHMRKKNEDKAQRAKKKLAKLKEMLVSGNTGNQASDVSDDGGCVSSSDDEVKRDRSLIDSSGKGRFITRPVPVGGTISVGVTVYVKKLTHERIDQNVNLDLNISEARDKEACSPVKTSFRLVDMEAYLNSNGKRDIDDSSPPPEHPELEPPRMSRTRKQPTEEIGELFTNTDSLDFGQLPIGESATRTIELTAHNGRAGFVFLQHKRVGGSGKNDAKVVVTPKNGFVFPNKSVVAKVTVTPMCGKLQKYLLDIKNLADASSVLTVMVTVCGIEVAPITVMPPTLDFETIYLATKQPVDRFGSKEPENKFLRVGIRNNLSTDLVVQLRSTHSAQCGLYTDLGKPEPQHEINSLKLANNAITPVYVALYPRLEREKSARGLCKRIEGALLVSSETGSWRKEIPFKCVVGCVALKAHGPAVIDLGTLRNDKRSKNYTPIRGTFTLENSNKELSLEYSISCNDTFLRVDNVEGFIPPSSTIEVSYTLTPHGSGLIQDTITIKNRSSSQMLIKRTLLLFLDDQCIKTSLAAPSGHLVLPLPVRGVTKSPTTVPTVETNYVFVNDQGRKRVQFTMHNKSGAELWLLPKCDLHGYDAEGNYVPCLTVCTTNDEFETSRLVPASNPPHVHARKGLMWSSAGSCLVLPRDKSILVMLEARCVPSYASLSSSNRRHLKHNMTVTVPCNLCFFVEKAVNRSSYFSSTAFSHGKAAQLVNVQIAMCSSHIEFAGKPEVSLGKIPATGKMPFNVVVRNTSQVETTMLLTMPPHMYVEPCQTPFQCSFPVESVDPMRLPSLAKPIPFGHPPVPFVPKVPVKRLSGSAPVGLNALTPPSTHMNTRCCSLFASPSEILSEIQNPFMCVVAEESDVTLHCVYCPATAEHDERGRIETRIGLANRHNASNAHSLMVTGVLERSMWSFEGIDTAIEDDGVLKLNSLIKVAPVGNDTGRADAKIVLRCNEAPATDEEATIQATLQLETKQEVVEFVSLKVLLLATNVSLPSSSELVFSRDEPTVELRVRCAPIPGKCISKALAEHMWRALLEDLLRDDKSKEKEMHMQYESSDTWDTSIADMASPFDIAPTYSVVHKLRDAAVKPSQVHLGTLLVESKGHPSSRKEIYGQVTQVPTYNIACHKKLVLYETNRTEAEKAFKGSLTVENLHKTDLHLLIRPVVRDGYNINVDMPSVVVVPANDRRAVPVTVQVPLSMEDDHLHDSVLLFFQDVNCLISVEVITMSLVKPALENDDHETPTELPVSESTDQLDTLTEVGVRLSADKKKDLLRADSPCDDKVSIASSLVHSPGKEREIDILSASGTDVLEYVSRVSTSDAPILKLSNCKAVDSSESCRQYSMSLTPGMAEGDSPDLMVTVENTSSRTVEASVDIIKLPGEAKWLSVNKTKLKISPHDKQTLTFSASTQNVGSFSTYVLLEVNDMPGESVSLRCSGEIQAWGPTAASCFDIVLDGKPTAPVRPHTYDLALGDVFYGEQVAHRCIDIVNNSDTRLEFNMSHTTEDVGGVKVSIETSLSLHTLRPVNRMSVEPHHTQRVYVWYVAEAEKQGKKETVSVITLKCRMVKDLTKTIMVRAKCNEPQLVVSASDIRVTEADNEAQVTVTNTCDVPVVVEFKRFALHAFSIPPDTVPQGPFNLPAGGAIIVKVVLDTAKIESLKKQHQKTSFALEEHFAVYNYEVPKEKKYVTLRAFVGIPVRGTLASNDVLHNWTTFNRLRDQIFLLIRQFKVFASLKEREMMLGLVEPTEEEEEDSSGGEGVEELVGAVDASMEEVQGMYLDFRWLTDELVYHGLQGKRGSYFDLAKLLFYGILSSWLFHNPLLQYSKQILLWRGQAAYFNTYSSLFGMSLGNIPAPEGSIDPVLRRRSAAK